MVRRMAPPTLVTTLSERFTSRLHDERIAAILGVCLGVSFTVCFATGMVSHIAQYPIGWLSLPSRPAGLYRVTQGLHVATGIAAVPLLLAKLWSVYPKLVEWPPVRGVAHAVERLLLLPLVAGSLFLLFSGVSNIARFYPWGFSFPAAHYQVAWVTIGALVAHIGAKVTLTRRVLRKGEASSEPATDSVQPAGLGRRQFLTTVGLTSGLLTLVTVGQTFEPLRRLALLAPRRARFGPQGVPVNRTAAGAKVLTSAVDPDYRLRIVGRVASPREYSLAELQALPQHRATLPITCVEGWSTSADWTGVPVRDLLEAAGARPNRRVLVRSLQKRGGYRTSVLEPDQAIDRDALLALTVNGEELNLDHGFPVRLIAPNRPGVLQTKWVTELRVR